jgi:hypothetical protein
MKLSWFDKRQSLSILVLSAVLVLAVPQTFAQSENSGAGLQGTWRVQINVISCTTGANLGPSFSSFLAFARGGTLTGTTRNPSFQPGQRTGDFGVWSQTEDGTYSADSEAFILFPSTSAPFFQSGTQKISQYIRLSGDTFDSAALTRFYSTDGTLLLSGCAQAVGTRYVM